MPTWSVQREYARVYVWFDSQPPRGSRMQRRMTGVREGSRYSLECESSLAERRRGLPRIVEDGRGLGRGGFEASDASSL